MKISFGCLLAVLVLTGCGAPGGLSATRMFSAPSKTETSAVANADDAKEVTTPSGLKYVDLK